VKRQNKAVKIIIVTLVVTVTLLVGTVALAAAYPDHPILQYFVIENPFTVPQQDTFPIVQILEENGLTWDKINNIQFAVLPDGGVITISDEELFLAVWSLLTEVEVTTVRARQARINDALSIYVDIQFQDPNHSAGIEVFGQVHILGRGPFVFTDSTSEQKFIELFTTLTSICDDYTPPESHNPGEDDGSEIITLPPPVPPTTEFLLFMELLRINGFVYNEIIEGTNSLEGILSVDAKLIILGDDIITVYEYNSNEEMETNAGYIGSDGSSISRPDYDDDDLTLTMMISWRSIPHWFKSDLVIVNYVGENEEIINFLTVIFGVPFAGGYH